MTTSPVHPPEPLTVLDRRSSFATVAVAWRTRQQPGGETVATRLRTAVERAGRTQGPESRPVHSHWSNSAGADCLVVTVPETGVRRWGTSVVHELHVRRGAFTMPVISATGSDLVTDAVTTMLSELEQCEPPTGSVHSSMRQTRQQGYEQTVITGANPAPRAGDAATFVALCALMAGPGRSLQTALNSAGNSSMVAINRTLEGGAPAIRWTVVSRAEESVHTLQAVLEVAGDLARAAIAEPAELIAFARANLNRPWVSPRDLAQAMAEYEVMGWGGHLIRDPDAALENIRPRLQGAFEGLLTPVTDVLGQPMPL